MTRGTDHEHVRPVRPQCPRHGRCPWSRGRNGGCAGRGRGAGDDRGRAQGRRRADRGRAARRRLRRARRHRRLRVGGGDRAPRWPSSAGSTFSINNAGIEVSSCWSTPAPTSGTMWRSTSSVTTRPQARVRAMRPGGAAGKGGTMINVASVAATIAFPGSPAIRPRSRRSTGSPAWPRWSRASSATASASTASTRVSCRPTWARSSPYATSGLGIVREPGRRVAAVVGLTPLGRLGEVSDMADAVLFLAVRRVPVHQRHGLPVDGGMGM